jgi:hypothetical protein
MANGADPAQGIDRIPWGEAVAFSIYGALQALGVPGHYAVGYERESAHDPVAVIESTACWVSLTKTPKSQLSHTAVVGDTNTATA